QLWSKVIRKCCGPRASQGLWYEKLLTWNDLGLIEARQAVIDLRSSPDRGSSLQTLSDDQWDGVNAGIGLRVQNSSRIGIDVRDLVVAELQLEQVPFAKSRQMALIAIQGALGLIIDVIMRAQDILKIDTGAANNKVVTDVAVLIQLRGAQVGIERQIGPAVHIAPIVANSKLHHVALGNRGFNFRSRFVRSIRFRGLGGLSRIAGGLCGSTGLTARAGTLTGAPCGLLG